MKIGLSADDLVQWGMSSYQETVKFAFMAITEDPDLNWLTDNPEEIQKLSMGEAIIRAVATMIEVNNASLYSSLKHLGAFRDLE